MSNRPALESSSHGGYSVEALLLPPGAGEEGLAIGVDSRGERIVAWGSRVSLDAHPTRFLPVPHRDCVACALTIPTAAISAISAPGSARVEVTASGILGDLARLLLERVPASTKDASRLDFIVLDEGEPASWQAAMTRLRPEGTLVALMAPGANAREFDFYPQVHARSLSLVPLPWYLPPLNPRGDFAEWHDAASRVSQQLLRNGSDVSGWVWETKLDSLNANDSRGS